MKVLIPVFALAAFSMPASADDSNALAKKMFTTAPPVQRATGYEVNGCTNYRLESPSEVTQICDPNAIGNLLKDNVNAVNYRNAFSSGSGGDGGGQ